MRLARVSVLATLLGLAPPLRAQVQLGVGADAHASPGGPVVASLMAGARVVTGKERAGHAEATFEGWVDASRLGAKRDSFPASVSGNLTLRVRARPAPNATVVAVLQPGTGVHTVGRQGSWTHVRRTVWIASSALPRTAAQAPSKGKPPVAAPAAAAATSRPSADRRADPPARPPARPPADPLPDPPGADGTAPARQGSADSNATAGRSVVAATGARVYDIPAGRVLGGLTPGSAVEVTGRQSGWVHVRADGWVAGKDLVAANGVAPPAVSAADLRADPEGMQGRVVQWDVEVMALQVADPLRVELARDEPYLLARGPGDENVVLYLAIPPSLLNEARALAPLSRVTVTAKVRSGRSEPAGTPILDLLTIIKR